MAHFSEFKVQLVSALKRRPIDEIHFFSLSAIIVIGTILFNRYALSSEWANSPNWINFVNWASEFYPGLRRVKNMLPDFTPKIGVLFALMWVQTPMHIILGLISVPFLPKGRKEDINLNCPWKSIIFTLIFASIFCADVIHHPYINSKFAGAIPINQASEQIEVLILSWILICGNFFLLGFSLGAAILKSTNPIDSKNKVQK